MERHLRHPDWSRHGPVTVRGRAFDGGDTLTGEALAARFRDATTATGTDGQGDTDGERTLAALAGVATDLAGFYAVVVDPPGPHTYLATDVARSIPLYYSADGTILGDHGGAVADAIDAARNPVTAAEFLLTRYVTGPDTVWQGVQAVQAGEVVRVGPDIERVTYYDHWPGDWGHGVETTTTDGDPVETLATALATALDRLETVADGRPLVVPLSGGYDSRLLVTSLVERGHDVTAFTFGRPGHPDVEMSREVAARLDVDWAFVEYDRETWREWYHGPAGQRHREWAFGGDALPFVAAHPAVDRLLASDRVPEDALWCPGHAVATPGERLPPFAGESDESDGTIGNLPADCIPDIGADKARESIPPTVDALTTDILAQHYTLWEWTDPAFEVAARKRIERGLLGNRDRSAVWNLVSAAAAYERWEWRGRMTTFTNGDLRGYEAAGVEWWLPLWDPAYVRAWASLSPAARRDRRAHTALAVRRYRRVADVPSDRAALTDRTLDPADRICARARYTPVRTATPGGGDWEPSFLAPRSGWLEGPHPLAWDGILHPAVRERVPDDWSLYALRTYATLYDIDLTDPDAELPEQSTVDLPTA